VTPANDPIAVKQKRPSNSIGSDNDSKVNYQTAPSSPTLKHKLHPHLPNHNVEHSSEPSGQLAFRPRDSQGFNGSQSANTSFNPSPWTSFNSGLEEPESSLQTAVTIPDESPEDGHKSPISQSAELSRIDYPPKFSLNHCSRLGSSIPELLTFQREKFAPDERASTSYGAGTSALDDLDIDAIFDVDVRPSFGSSVPESSAVFDEVHIPERERLAASERASTSYGAGASVYDAYDIRSGTVPEKRYSCGSSVVATESDMSSKKDKDEAQAEKNKSLHYKIRDLPTKGFFLQEPKFTPEVPFGVRYECVRLRAHGIENPKQNINYDKFWQDNQNLGYKGQKCQRAAWRIANSPVKETDLTLALTAKATFAAEKEPSLLNLTLTSLTMRKSNRYFRQFGGHRFLSVYLPDLSKSPLCPNSQSETARKTLVQWLTTTKTFLGRKWSVIYFEPHKSKTSNSQSKEHVFRAIFFALEGVGISRPMTVAQVLSWHFAFGREDNLEQPFTKAFSRFALGK
jgi:hypothetical protein